MRGSGSRRRARGIRSAVPLSAHQGLLRGVALASVLGVGAMTGFGAAGMGPLSALAGDSQRAATEAGELPPAASDGGGAVTGPAGAARIEDGARPTEDPAATPTATPTPTPADGSEESPTAEDAPATTGAPQDGADRDRDRDRDRERGGGSADSSWTGGGESSGGGWQAPVRNSPTGDPSPTAPGTAPAGEPSDGESEEPTGEGPSETPGDGGTTPPGDGDGGGGDGGGNGSGEPADGPESPGTDPDEEQNSPPATPDPSTPDPSPTDTPSSEPTTDPSLPVETEHSGDFDTP